MKTAIGAIGLSILIALGWIAWPYYALYDFANAMQRGDRLALDHRVAWDSVRRGLREDLSESFARSRLSVGLGVLIGPTIINSAIDSYVTPRGIAGLVRVGKAFQEVDQRSSTSATKEQEQLSWAQVRYAFFSGGPLTFRLDIGADNAKSGGGPVTTLLFRWSGTWKLTRLILPLDAIQNMTGASRG